MSGRCEKCGRDANSLSRLSVEGGNTQAWYLCAVCLFKVTGVIVRYLQETD